LYGVEGALYVVSDRVKKDSFFPRRRRRKKKKMMMMMMFREL
jgi:hypothetical protein